MCAFTVSEWNTNVIKVINGISFGAYCGANTEKLNGVSLSFFTNSIDELNGLSVGFLNSTKDLHGVLIGLWNVAENNKIFKRTPFINFNFRKKANR